MPSPVTVSRIQNRRGTQAEFYSLYPAGYSGTGGFSSFPAATTNVTGLTANGTEVTLFFTASPPFPALVAVNSEITFTNTPATNYDGTYFVIASTATSITFSSTVTDAYTVGSGVISYAYSLVNYPGVLMQGELALCTDTRNVYIGNIGGEYIQLATGLESSLVLLPLVSVLSPTATFTTIPALTLPATPFNTIFYDLTDSPSPNWNDPGTNFSRNGQLQITATATTATLADQSVEINTTLGEIVFQAVKVGGSTEIQYTSSFATPITFSTSTLNWLPF